MLRRKKLVLCLLPPKKCRGKTKNNRLLRTYWPMNSVSRIHLPIWLCLKSFYVVYLENIHYNCTTCYSILTYTYISAIVVWKKKFREIDWFLFCRRQVEKHEQQRKTTLLRGTSPFIQITYGEISRLPIQTQTKTNLYCWRQKASHLRIQKFDEKTTGRNAPVVEPRSRVQFRRTRTSSGWFIPTS